MKHVQYWKTIACLTSIFTIFLLLSSIISSAEPLTSTTLEILSIKGGFGKAVFDIKNTGLVTAKNITLNITVKGGIFGRIDITKICKGCSKCGPDMIANATRSESTAETGKIFGFGSVDILVSAQAENAEKVTKTKTGFVLGFLVIVN